MLHWKKESRIISNDLNENKNSWPKLGDSSNTSIFQIKANGSISLHIPCLQSTAQRTHPNKTEREEKN
jgi:hypothetical protein